MSARGTSAATDRVEDRLTASGTSRRCVPQPGTGTWFAPRRHRQPLSALRSKLLWISCISWSLLHPNIIAFCLQVCYPASRGLTTKCVWFVCLDDEPGPIDGGNRPCKRRVQPPALHWPFSLAVPIDSATPLFPHTELDWRAPCLRIPFIESQPRCRRALSHR